MKLRTSLQLLKGPLDMAPLVDVVLLLLLFFMLSSTLVLQPGVEVTLHERIIGSGTQANKRVLTISKSQEIYFNDQKIDLEKLSAELKSFSSRGDGASIIIKADISTPNGMVMSVMNIALTHGIHVMLATRNNLPEQH